MSGKRRLMWHNCAISRVSGRFDTFPQGFISGWSCQVFSRLRQIDRTWHALLQVAEDILLMHGIAQRMRARRQAGGSLRLDNVRLGFELDAAGEPFNSVVHVQR